MPGEEEVNFERVTKVYREESAMKTLVSLEDDFWDKLAAYVARLEESAGRETQTSANSPKALLLQDELRKVLKRREQIFTYRERKLALLASTRAGGADLEMLSLPRQERALFDNMIALMKRTRADTFGGPPFGSEPAPSVPGAPAPAEETPPAETVGSLRVVRSEETKRPRTAPSLKDHVLVHVLEDLPPFAGLDTTYHLKKEDVVTLPKTLAEVLVSRGKARVIEVADAAG